MRFGDVELLVETTRVVGTEPTSALDTAREKVVDAYERAQAAIVAVAASTVDVLGQLNDQAVSPRRVEVEFGVKFSGKGNVIVAGVAAEATLLVRLVYEAPAPAGT